MIDIDSHILTTRLQIDNDRRLLADRLEIVNVEFHFSFARHCQKMQHRIR